MRLGSEWAKEKGGPGEEGDFATLRLTATARLVDCIEKMRALAQNASRYPDESACARAPPSSG